MAVSAEYKDFVTELMSGFCHVQIRNMFGGAGVYRDGVMFALIAGETLYFKVDDLNRADYEAEDMPPFLYEPPSGKVISMSYYELPERLYDDPEELSEWARKAFDAALKAKAVKEKKGSAKKKTARRGKGRAV